MGPLAVLLFVAIGCSSSNESETSEVVGTESSALAFANVQIKVISVTRGNSPLDDGLDIAAQFVGFNAPSGNGGEPPGQRLIGTCNPSCDALPPSTLGPWTKSLEFNASTPGIVSVAGQLIIRVNQGFIPPTFQRCFHFGLNPLTGALSTVPAGLSACPGGTGNEAQLSSVTCSGTTCTAELKIDPPDSQPWRFTFEVTAACAGTGSDTDCNGKIDGCVCSEFSFNCTRDVHGDPVVGLSTCDGFDDDCNGIIDDLGTHRSGLCNLCTGPVFCSDTFEETDTCTAECATAPAPTQAGIGWINPDAAYDFDVGGDILCYVSGTAQGGSVFCTNQIGNAGNFPKAELSTPEFLVGCTQNIPDDKDTCHAGRVSVDPNGRAWASSPNGVFVQVGQTLQRVTALPPQCIPANPLIAPIAPIELVGPPDRNFQGPTSRPFLRCSGGLFELDLATLAWVNRSVPARFAGTSPSHAHDLFVNAPSDQGGSGMFELGPTNQVTGLTVLGVNSENVAVGGVFAVGNDFTGPNVNTGGNQVLKVGDPARDPGLVSQWNGSALVPVADVMQPLDLITDTLSKPKPPAAVGKYGVLSAPTSTLPDPTLSFVFQKVVEGGGAGVGGPSPAGTTDVIWVLNNTGRMWVYNLPPLTPDIRDSARGDDSLPVSAFFLSAPNASPTALCKDVSIDANASCTGTVTAVMINAGSSDPDGTPVTLSIAHPTPLRVGVNQVELVVSDGTLSSTCWSSVTLRDTVAPVLTVPAAVNVKTCAFPAAVTAGQATATDVCGVPVVTGRVIASNGVTLVTPIPVTGGSAALPPGTHTIEWTATDGTNTTRANQTVTVGALIEANSSFIVNDRAQVKAAAGGFAAVFNAGTGNTRIGNNSHTGGVLSRGPVNVLHNAILDGGITSAGAVNVPNDATVNGVVVRSTPVTLPGFAALPTFPTPTGSDRVVNAGATLTLTPSSYASVTVNGSGTLVLGAGDYYFTGLIVNSLSTVRVTSTTRIFVKTTLALRSSFTTNGVVQSIYLGFAGTVADMMAPFQGTLLAPAARVVFGTGGGMTFMGSFFARDIELSPDTVLVCRP